MYKKRKYNRARLIVNLIQSITLSTFLAKKNKNKIISNNLLPHKEMFKTPSLSAVSNQMDSLSRISSSTSSSMLQEINLSEDHIEAISLCQRLNDLIKNLRSICNDPFNVVHDQTSDFRSQVYISREKIKLAIDEYADKLITNYDQYELERKRYVESDQFEETLKTIEIKLKYSKCDHDKWMSVLNRPKSDTNGYKAIKEKCSKLIQKLENQLKDIEQSILENDSFKMWCMEKQLEKLKNLEAAISNM